jgi:biopolymer transport protein ExbB
MIEDFTSQLTSIGGPVLIALLIASLVATATAIFKIVQFMQEGVGKHRTAEMALSKWNIGKKQDAYEIASSNQTPLARVAAQAMHTLAFAPNDVDLAKEQAFHVARDILNRLARHLRILESVVQAAPMMGLLGTVLGMIDAFGELAKGDGAVDPTQLAGGIWVALSTTAFGLTIAIPFYFIANWLESRIERERIAMVSIISSIVFRNQSEKTAPNQKTGTLLGL